MPANNNHLFIAISQIILDDPESESPRIHNKRKKISKRQLIRRLELMIQELEELEVEVDLTPYKDSVDCLKKLKKEQDYNDLVQEVIDGYDSSYGVEIDPENQMDHSWSAQEIQKEQSESEEIETGSHEKGKQQSY